MDTTISVTASGLALSGPLLAGERVSVSVSGIPFAEGAKPTLVLLSRFPDALLASVELTEGEEGAWSGVLDTATRQVGGFFATARADERRDAVLELIDANGETRESVARLLVPFGNSALCPSPMHAQPAASVYVAGPKGDKGDPGTSIPLPVSVANGGTGATTASGARAELGVPAVVPPTIDAGEGAAAAARATAQALDVIAAAIPSLPLSIANGGTGATTAAAARANLGAVSRAGDESLTGSFATDGFIKGRSAIGTVEIVVGDSTAQTPGPYIIIDKDGILLLFNGTASAPIALPFGKQASDPTNTMPVLATDGDLANGLAAKQNAIPDLATIRSGAAAGATAVQPSAMPASETWTFTVDDGQGGTSTVTKQVAVYAAAKGAGA